MRTSTAKTIFIGFILWIGVMVVYLAVATHFFSDFHPSNFPYFTLLAESFLQRRYDLIHPPANPFDLSIYQGAVYLPWGPLPAVVLMPLVWLFGIGISDKVYTAFFGSFNVVLVFLLLLMVNRVLKKPARLIYITLLTLFFAFGTVHFSMSVIGRVWFTSQIISLSVFLLSLLFLVGFLKQKNIAWFIVSIGLLLLSFMGRLWQMMLLPIYIAVLLANKPSRREMLTAAFVFLVIGMVLSRMYMLYNLRRFGSVFETGYTYQQEADQFLTVRNTYGRFHPVYLVKNVWYELINPIAFSPSFPFIKPDPMGNGLFVISPLFILLGLLSKVWKKEKKLILFCVSSAILYSIQPMLYLGTGYYQFGPRYLLEIMPFLLILLLLIVPRVSKKIIIPLWLFSITICSLGAWWLATI